MDEEEEEFLFKLIVTMSFNTMMKLRVKFSGSINYENGRIFTRIAREAGLSSQGHRARRHGGRG